MTTKDSALSQMTSIMDQMTEDKKRVTDSLYAAALSGIRVAPNPQLRGNQQMLMVSPEIYEELMKRYGEPPTQEDET